MTSNLPKVASSSPRRVSRMRKRLLLALLATSACARQRQRVLITSPPAYAERLAAKLARLDDVDVCRGATIATNHFEGSDLAALGAALRGPVDIVAFTSRRGVEAALAAAPERVRALPCYALGADREALDAAGVADVVSPEDPSPKGLVAALAARVPPDARAATVVCAPVPRVVPPLVEPPVVPEFCEALAAAGFRVARVDAYETRATDDGVAADAIRAGTVDVVAVTSTAEIDALAAACDLDAFAGVDVVAHGPVTALGIRRAGLGVAETNLDSSSFDGLVDAVARVCRRRDRRARVAALATRAWFVQWLLGQVAAHPDG